MFMSNRPLTFPFQVVIELSCSLFNAGTKRKTRNSGEAVDELHMGLDFCLSSGNGTEVYLRLHRDAAEVTDEGDEGVRLEVC